MRPAESPPEFPPADPEVLNFPADGNCKLI